MNEFDNKRPIGISILAGLHIIVSITAAVIIVLYIPKLLERPDFYMAMDLLGIPR